MCVNVHTSNPRKGLGCLSLRTNAGKRRSRYAQGADMELVGEQRKKGWRRYHMMKYLQKLGKALMLPVAALPVAGILRLC